MSTTTENSVAGRWIAQILKGDTGAGGAATLSTGGIHRNRAPRNATYPLTIVRFQGGSDVNALGAARRVSVNALWAVYAVIREDSVANIDVLAARIDTLLNGKMGTASGGIVLSCVRESPLELPSLEDGIGANMLGGIYRIQAQLT